MSKQAWAPVAGRHDGAMFFSPHNRTILVMVVVVSRIGPDSPHIPHLAPGGMTSAVASNPSKGYSSHARAQDLDLSLWGPIELSGSEYNLACNDRLQLHPGNHDAADFTLLGYD